MQSGYRYSGIRHNAALLALGNVRIGTLHDFRRVEHLSGISDLNEGKKSVSHHVKYARNDKHHSKHFKAMRQFGLLEVHGGGDAHISNVLMVQEFDHPDCFVHCMSSELSKEVMHEFGGADSCLEIKDVSAFYERLTQTLNLHVRVRLLTVSKVSYLPRDEIWNGKDWGVHPALMKEKKFSKQREVRAIWAPDPGQIIAPIIINDIGLLQFCRARSLDEPSD
ncbi:hypothetical protein CXB38_03890 [Pseudomonas syringae]|uniref:hypothetical protein n=1 Tax=Pseudomonas syringae TaxID=317 RepID=UPI000CDB1D93|nr:hypothetical protein [Pseudomonas syringae]POP84426.1 hypothetical protein CXB38_03890 [Pseudomonas syringae]